MANNNPKGSTKGKVTAIALLVAAIATAVAFWADGDDTTTPDTAPIVDGVQDVRDQFGDDEDSNPDG